MLAFPDICELRPRPLEIKYKIVTGSLTYCEEELNQLGKDYRIDVLQAFPDRERTDYIIMILALVPKTKK